MKVSQRITYISISILFLLFAIVQYNDPDAVLWMSAYLSISILAFLLSRNIYYRPIFILLIAVFAAWNVGLIQQAYQAFIAFDENTPPNSAITHTANPKTEVFKELGGVFIGFLALIYLFVNGRKHTTSIR